MCAILLQLRSMEIVPLHPGRALAIGEVAPQAIWRRSIAHPTLPWVRKFDPSATGFQVARNDSALVFGEFERNIDLRTLRPHDVVVSWKGIERSEAVEIDELRVRDTENRAQSLHQLQVVFDDIDEGDLCTVAGELDSVDSHS